MLRIIHSIKVIYKQLKSNYSLIPIAILAPFALSMATFSLLRLSLYSPDIIINSKNKFCITKSQIVIYFFFI